MIDEPPRTAITGDLQVLLQRHRPTTDDLRQIEQMRKEMWRAFRHVPPGGRDVDHLGRSYRVYRDVFWPHRDSTALIQMLRLPLGANVADMGSGCGVTAIAAAFAGARRVLALDSSPAAVRCTQFNARRYGFQTVVEARRSEAFSGVDSDERFDAIIANLPFTDCDAADLTEATMCDPGLGAWRDLFRGAPHWLRAGGRLFFSQANFGNVDQVLGLAAAHGFRIDRFSCDKVPGDPRVFFAFEATL